jgi:hypothetical protein
MARPSPSAPSAALQPKDLNRRALIVPSGCIASVPPQSAESCERAIALLTDILEELVANLALHVEILFDNDSSELSRDTNDYLHDLQTFIQSLKRDWPHLNRQPIPEPRQDELGLA